MKTDIEKMLEAENEELVEYLLGLLPDAIQRIFWVHNGLENKTIEQQQDRVLQEIVAKTTILPPEVQEDYSGPRAYCPLCNVGSKQPYKPGFAYPKGLERHLTGWKCVPYKYGIKRLEKRWRCQFGEQEAQASNEAIAEKAHRKKHEILYKIHPTAEPKLVDEMSFLEKCRTPESLLFAEARLSELGMFLYDEGNIRSYTQDYGQYILFADPRTEGKITFMLCLKNPPKRRKFHPQSTGILDTFTIYDRSKNGLKLKLNNFCKDLIAKQDQKNPIK